ncbi:HAD family hydrolase [Vibrio neonatus]|uniref:HAD family hydrolase n=1 Tax=Vibrio neonatus TaxID=278860 RepID=UPI0021C35D9B|nr:HAD family hydrolase [Vibrio neonatus]
MTQSLYVFDLDDTLIDGDSAMLWHQYLVEHAIIQDPNFLAEDQRLMSLYAEGKLDMQQYLDFATAPLTKITQADLAVLADNFTQQCIAPLVFPQAKDLLDNLQQSNTTVVLISATVDYLVQAIAKMLGIKHAYGIQLESNQSYLQSQIKGIATFREGKVTCLEQWLEQHPSFKEHHIVFYSDSINDKPMCLRADSTFVVNPCPQLSVAAHINGWPALNWAL